MGLQLTNSNKLARTKWACRRGMLELDCIFNDFLKSGYEQLTESQKDDFLVFLGNIDPDLYSWLMGFRQAEEEADKLMVKIIRDAIDLL